MAKHLCENDVATVYKLANSEDIVWDYLFDDVTNAFFGDLMQMHNLPHAFFVGTLIPATAALCGSKTTVQTGTFVNPLNTFTCVIGEPGCGKSRCQNLLWGPMADKLLQKYDICMSMDNFTTAGFQEHQKQTQGYGLITSSEGERFLKSIISKQSKNEGEESRLNTVWDGIGDTTFLKGGARGYNKTSVSMCLYIQPEPLISLMSHLYHTNGFFERILFFSAKPNLCSNAMNDQAKDSLEMYPKDVMGTFADVVFSLHKDEARQYTLDPEANEFYQRECDKYNASIMARHENFDEYPMDDSGKFLISL